MELRENINRMLNETYVAAFAFCDGEKTYQSWMHFARVNEQQITVISPKNRNHSRMALDNPHVSLAVLPMQNPGKQPRGMAAQGAIEFIPHDDERVDALYKAYAKVHGQKQAWLDAAKTDDENSGNFWLITIDKFIVYDKHCYGSEARQEVAANNQ